jgi:NADH dehydrogenase FAD-containing subunit
VLAANRLAGKLEAGTRLVLVTPGDTLVDRVRLHERAARGREVEHALSALLHPRVEHMAGRAIGLDPAQHTLSVERSGKRAQLSYDALILALGSRMASPIPLETPHAHALADSERALALFQALRALPDGARVAIVGGGLTAIELAAEVAEAEPRLNVVLLSDQLARGLHGPARDALKQGLRQIGVEVREQARVRALCGSSVRFADGRPDETFALSVFAAGFLPTALGPEFKLPQNRDGRVPVDDCLRVEGLSDVFAAGDIAAPPSATVGHGLRSTRMACASALPLGAHAADQVARLCQNRALVPYHFSYFAQCISLGRSRGVVAFVDADDQPTGRILNGRKAALIKELICRFVLTSIRLERMFAGLYAWPGRRRSLSLAKAPVNQLPG